MAKYKLQKFPPTRIATIDISEVGKQKHHLAALIEVDVTKGLEEIKAFNAINTNKISFTAWLIRALSSTIKKHETTSAYLISKGKLIIFEDINVSIIVEKELNGQRVPIPLVIEKANEIGVEFISQQIDNARKQPLTAKDMVLMRRTSRFQRLYYMLPGFMRRYVWKYILKHPKIAFKNMGNVAFTSIGMMGKVNGWFIPISIHPICIGISSRIKKPIVIGDKIEIREMLNMTILLDHDVIDGAPMARFVAELTSNIENGLKL
jgi:pyruvate/2-oxoglutarate dehydrogenase complex dihydrolipoamide acyltransferase (E2) component